MRNLIQLLLVGLVLTKSLYAQNLNLSFENESLPPWYLIGDHQNYDIKSVPDEPQEGNKSLFIQNTKSTDTFGGLMLSIPQNIKGDSIEVIGKFKTKDISETSKLGFMLRIDPGVYFNNMQDANINGTADWKEYSIKAKLQPNKTTGIFLGVFLIGEGMMWADDIRIKVDGKLLDKEVYTAYKKNDEVTFTSSGVKDIVLTDDVHNRLVDLGKIWGLLKYRHPTVAKGNTEWDKVLFTAINFIVNAADNTEVEKYYAELLTNLGKVERFPLVFSSDKVALPSNYEWIDQLAFSSSLKNELKNLQYANFDKHHYYGFAPGVGNVEIKNEHAYIKIQDPNPDIGLRLLSLFRYWNIVHYFSPYRNLTDKPWDSILKEYIPKMINANTPLGYQETVAAILCEIKDAHTKLWTNTTPLMQKYGTRFLPVRIKIIENKPVVTELSNSSSVINSLQVGDVILKKNGKTLKEIQDSVYHIIASPNQAVIDREMGLQLAKSIEEKEKLQIDRNGKQLTVEVQTVFYNDLKFNMDTTVIKFLDNDIAYVNHGLLTEEIMLKNLDALEKTKGIIIDGRNYPKEFLVFKVTPHLLNSSKEFVMFSKTSFHRLGEFAFSPSLKVGGDNPNPYKGKIAILMNEETQSSAEYHIMAYQQAEKAKIFGSQTAGADGNTSGFTLPGGLYSYITGIGVFYPDGKETQRIGLIPDVEIKPTIKGIRKGKDEVLEKALEYLKQ